MLMSILWMTTKNALRVNWSVTFVWPWRNTWRVICSTNTRRRHVWTQRPRAVTVIRHRSHFERRNVHPKRLAIKFERFKSYCQFVRAGNLSKKCCSLILFRCCCESLRIRTNGTIAGGKLRFMIFVYEFNEITPSYQNVVLSFNKI